MTGLVTTLIAILILWMFACAVSGYRRSFGLFVAVLVTGLVLNMAWMMIGLDARMLEPHALMAQGAVTLYGLCAFGFGWIAGRIMQAWRESAV